MIRQSNRIIDVFPFNDEEGPLLARYLELNSIVDQFVAIEGNVTHSGRPKNPRFLETVERLGLDRSRFHLIQVNLPASAAPFEKDRIQRDSALQYLTELFDENDLILFGDVDEVPALEAVELGIDQLKVGFPMAIFAQWMCVGLFNNVERSRRLRSFAGEFNGIRRRDKRWLGTVLVRLGSLGTDFTLSDLRKPENKEFAVRLENGGWHLSSCGGPLTQSPESRIVAKLQDSAHVEFQHIRDEDLVRKRFDSGKDVLGRRFVRFTIVSPTNFLSDRIRLEPRLANLIRE